MMEIRGIWKNNQSLFCLLFNIVFTIMIGVVMGNGRWFHLFWNWSFEVAYESVRWLGMCLILNDKE